MIKRLCIGLVGLIGIAASPVLGWTPSECGPEVAQDRQGHARRMLEAAEGSPLYAPKPYPKRTDDVVEDFRYAFLTIKGDNDLSEAPPEERLLYEGLQSGELKFTVQRVEDWSLGRCRGRRANAVDYLIRVFRSDGETEIARATVMEDGLLGAYQYRPEDETIQARWGKVLRSPEATRAELASKLGVQASRAQLVQTSGTLQCPLLEPCVALHADGRELLVNKQGEVYEVRAEAQRFTRREATHPSTRSAVAEGRWEGEERLVSIGNEFAVARRIGLIDPTVPPK